MRSAVLAVALAGLLPAAATAQQAPLFDYHLLLDSTVPAASAALVASGHRADAVMQRPDGSAQSPFTRTLIDSSGAVPMRTDLNIVLLSQGPRITRIMIRASAHGADTVLFRSTLQALVARLTTAYGRSATSGEEAGWCWSTPRRFVDLSVDRDAGQLSLTLGISSNER